ncbi:hexuronate transporter [Phenylobacterium zucineum HLK1]|uniref:Hexuronate transporter n=1 Tax=Phenylobacterium zucineum (strain HLK1) TaxID=450851 RepID=B4RGG7_PHEZH|nr:MFS transporter [Phenylobacterium zucineum]ACG78873.1 hexuronate transporter [Phenylobacterium zucineum HLK1]
MRRLWALRWWIIALVMLGAMLNYLTRATMGVAAPTMLADLSISEREYGWITGAFQAGIMLQPAVGYVLDTLGLRTGLAIFAGAWSAISIAHGFASTWPAFAALRGLLGFAEGSANPAGMKVVATWFPARERGFAGGVYNIGASFGTMLAPPLVAWAILAFNWRAAFIITGLLGLVWTALWWWGFRTPDQHPRLSPQERAKILEGQEPDLHDDGARPSMLKLMARRDFWGIAIPRLLADPTWGTLAFWIPLYLVQTRGFDLKQIAMFAWLPFLAADLGCLFGPAVVEFLQRRGVSLINARRGAFTLGALMMTGMMFVGRVESPYLAIALLCLGGFAHQTLSVTVITMASDLFKRNEVATVAGMAGTFGNLGVLIFSLLIGGLVATVGYDPFFLALGLLDLVGAAVLWTLVRDRPVRAPVSELPAA